MSRLLNPKRTPCSTPILQRFSQSNLRKTTPNKSDLQSTIPLLNWLTSPPPKGNRLSETLRNLLSLILSQTTTNPLRNRNSMSPTYLGMNPQIVHQLNIATPIARKPVGYYKYTTMATPKQNSLSNLPQITSQNPFLPLLPMGANP